MIKPIDNNVLIKKEDDIKVTKGGIILPDNCTEKPNTGTVLAVGMGKQNKHGKFIKPDVDVGDVVLYENRVGVDVKVNGQECVILEEYNIMAIVKEE